MHLIQQRELLSHCSSIKIFLDISPYKLYSYGRAANDAVPGGDELLLAELCEFERLLCAVSIVFYPAGRQNCPPAQVQSPRFDG
jgi:hypothetical protein